MTEKHFIVATAGHVDHGKSALVKALTGTDPDRLPEEKARKITIDLGFAELKLKAADGTDIHVGIVDVPGHEDFVRNMIAGVGSIDLALFVVAADDGWMPQTEEHRQILTYLGVSRCVIALTKVDIGDADTIATQIREQIRESPFADAPIVPLSVRQNFGLEGLESALARELSAIEPQRDIGKPRLFVDRVFTLHGIGTVATGTLTGGIFQRGEAAIIQPGNLPIRIRSIQSHGRDVDHARPGTRTAVNITDVADASAISRGNVATTVAAESSNALDVILHRSSRLQRASVLKQGSSAYVHHGTSRVRAKVVLLERETLRPGESGIAQLRLASPIFAFLEDRFVLRDGSEQSTIAGGIVLDPDGDQKYFRSDAQRRLLEARATAHDDIDVCIETELARRGPSGTAGLLLKSRFSAADISDALTRLVRRGEIFLNGEIAAHSSTWQKLRTRAAEFIDAEHNAQPERSGTRLNDLRAALHDITPNVLEALIVDLCSTGFIRRGSVIGRATHRAALPPHLDAVANGILSALSQKPLDPPGRKQIAPDTQTRQVLSYLIDQGEAVEISSDLVLSREAFAHAKTIIAEFISENGSATVSELRQSLQTSRRVIVPLLERLDRDRLTQRIGDQRRLIEKL